MFQPQRNHFLSLFLLLFLFSISRPAVAQNSEAPDTIYTTIYHSPDTSKVYDLGEITVSGNNQKKPLNNNVNKIRLADIALSDAHSTADFARLIPAAYVQTNSRGETLIYLRNAGERQLALYFDGALLNIPWDNRIDTKLIPTSVIGGMNVIQGVPSMLYGANVAGGVINMVSRNVSGDQSYTEISGQGQNGETFEGSVSHLGSFGNFSYAISGGYSQSKGLNLPAGANLAFNQPDSSLRLNTDFKRANVFLRGQYRISEHTSLGITALQFQGERGVAPEGHKDSAVSKVRFWRYPETKNRMLIANFRSQLSPSFQLQSSAWIGDYKQSIESYSDFTYNFREAIQHDKDKTAGGRIILDKNWTDQYKIDFAVNFLQSTHQQTELVGLPADSTFEQYKQLILSAGTDYHWTPNDKHHLILGLGLDQFNTPETGDKPARGPLLDYGLKISYAYKISDPFTFQISAGRKTRFPTMRELFGTSLNKFADNPNLIPESVRKLEIGLSYESINLRVQSIFFSSLTNNAIDIRNINVNGSQLKQRFNLAGSGTYGVELVSAWYISRNFKANGHLTFMRTRGQSENGDLTVKLAEKPSVIGRFSIAYQPAAGFSLMTEAILNAGAFGLSEDDELVPLGDTPVLNARLGYRSRSFSNKRALVLETFIRLDNLLDETVYSQLGLPSAGRTLSAGVKMAF